MNTKRQAATAESAADAGLITLADTGAVLVATINPVKYTGLPPSLAAEGAGSGQAVEDSTA